MSTLVKKIIMGGYTVNNQKSLNSTKSKILLIAGIAILLFCVIVIKAPTAISLAIAATVEIALCMIWGYTWDELQKDIVDSVRTMMPSVFIILCVGMLVGVWILCGTVPILVYYGLKVLKPGTFLFATCIICSITSIFTGTSWGTLSTVGIALMAVSEGLGIPAHYTAGAVVVGAIFGDKQSPLSDTTILASAVAEVDIKEHMKHMLTTTLPGLIVSLLLYLIIGARFRTGTVNLETVNLMLDTLKANFNLNPILLLPPIVVLVLIFKGKPTIPVFGIGIILGALLAAIFQGANFSTIASALNSGFQNFTGVDIVDSMLIRGGLNSMLGTTALLIIAAAFGSPLKTSGVVNLLIEKIQIFAKSDRSLLVSTYLLHCFLFAITGSYYVTFSAFGPMLKTVFDKYDLHGVNLSRLLEDTGTAFAPLVPWSTTGAFVATTLGVATGKFALFAPMLYLGIILGIIYSAIGFKVVSTNQRQGVKST